MLFCTVHEVIERLRPVVPESASEVLPVVDPLVEELPISRICLSHGPVTVIEEGLDKVEPEEE